MGFGEAVKKVFRDWRVFQGRSRRAEFWWFYLFLQLVGVGFGLIFGVLLVILTIPLAMSTTGTTNPDTAIMGSLGILLAIYGLAIIFSLVVFVLQLGVWVRRLHDTGQSGHWLWLNLVGLGIVPLIMAIMEGQPHDNQYGPDPKAAERAAYLGYAGYGAPAAASGYAAPSGYSAPAGYAVPPAGAELPATSAAVPTPAPMPPVDPHADPFAAPPPQQ